MPLRDPESTHRFGAAAISHGALQSGDEQVRGPYSKWRHLHTFAECEQGTRMTDRVEYRLPFRLAAPLARPLVRRQLDRIFRYRANAIQAFHA